MYVPPGYKQVTVLGTKGKVYATGYDNKGRKQTVYNKWYIEKKRKERFQRVFDLKPVFEKISKDVADMIKHPPTAPSKKTQIALIIRLMILCNFRIGSHVYLQKYGSYGLTTLKWKHVHFLRNSKFEIRFIGKKGVENYAICDDVYICRILRKMYTKDNDFIFDVSAAEVNAFIKKYDKHASAKDIRTWQANVLYIKFFEEAQRKNVEGKPHSYALKKVATLLHNTATVCKSSYIHPKLLKL